MMCKANSYIEVLTLDLMVLPILAGSCVYNDKVYHAGDAIVVADASNILALTDLELGYIYPFKGSCAAAIDEVLLVSEEQAAVDDSGLLDD